jgi:putative DNA primase/helicase
MSELYRGYVKTKNKACLQKFGHGEKLLKYADVKNLEEFGGVLADDVVLIDIDDSEQAEKLLEIVKTLNLNTKVLKTSRGKHFYFKNSKIKSCSTHSKLACGLTADIKVGSKNSYAIIKFGGKLRDVEYITEEIDEVPDFLLPVKTKIDVYNMAEGAGRNDALYRYILALQQNGFKKESIRNILNIINRFIFAVPVDEKELETISRDEAFFKDDADLSSRFFTSKGAFRHDEFAKYLLEQYRIVKINNQLHIYVDGIYEYGEKIIQAEMIKHVPNLTKAKRAEVMAYLDLLVLDNVRVADAEWIAFQNGIFNIETLEFMDFSPDIVITNKIPHNYNPNAYSEVASHTLDKLACNDKKIRMLLEEIIGYTFYRRNELRKAFILLGDRHNGKSTYLDMIGRLLGEKNTSSLDLKELGDRFKTAELMGKLANIGDDIDDEFIKTTAIFKKVVSGDKLNAERKGQDPFDFAPYAKQMFSANTLPRIKDKSGAVIDRLIIVPFNASFSRNDPDFDPYIKYKLREESVMEYLINLGLAALTRVLDTRGFTEAEKVKECAKEYNETNNPILLYFKDLDVSALLGVETKALYQDYGAFCINNNFQPMSIIEFSKTIKAQFNLSIKVTKINGKSVRVFA